MRRGFGNAGAAVIFGLAAGALVIAPGAALAQKGEPAPKPKIDCSKKANQGKAACQNKNQELSDDEIFFAGYWLARKGEFTLALHYLNQARNKDDARVLTYIGYATRKLGNVDAAMGYYARALEIDANYTVARAYLGEAHLQRGERQKATDQLAEISARCGTTCEEYKELATALAKPTRRG
jgi:tetratricopeptide (TPR) repeat protein